MKLLELQEGQIVIVDGSFDCIEPGAARIVQRDEAGLFIHCSRGHHYLDGQEGDDGELVGLV